MIYLLLWSGSGVFAWGLFRYLMWKKYPEMVPDEEDEELALLQLFVSVFAGPITFFALFIIFGEEDEDLE